MIATEQILGAAKSAAVMPLGYLGYREIRMNEQQYERVKEDLKVKGFGTLCGLPVVVNGTTNVEIVGVVGAPSHEGQQDQS
jgi:hypothetical protein